MCLVPSVKLTEGGNGGAKLDHPLILTLEIIMEVEGKKVAICSFKTADAAPPMCV